jgi:hypothetical protein
MRRRNTTWGLEVAYVRLFGLREEQRIKFVSMMEETLKEKHLSNEDENCVG